jgi:hypothetical protein
MIVLGYSSHLKIKQFLVFFKNDSSRFYYVHAYIEILQAYKQVNTLLLV